MSKPCPAYSNPSRTRRTVLAAGPECAPGSGRTKGLTQLPLYENFNILQPEFDTINLNRAKPGLGPEGFAAGLGFYRLTATVYVFGSGYGNVPPPWTVLLEAAGWEGSRYYLSTTTPVVITGVTAVQANDSDGDMALGFYYYRFASVVNGVEQAPTTAANALEEEVDTTNNSIDIDFNVATTAYADNDVVVIYRSKRQATAVGGANAGTYYKVGQITLTTSTNEVFRDTWGDLELGDELPLSGASALAADYPSGFTTDSAHAIWKPVSENHKSLTVWAWLDHAKYPATGVRGNINFTGDVGALFQGAVDFQGVYNTRVVEANPTTLAGVNPGIPPRVCGIDFTITPESTPGSGTGTPFTPVVKRVGVNLGTNATQRLDGNADECLIEIGIFNEFDTRWTAQIEVDSTNDWIEHFKIGTRFKLDMTIGPVTSPTGKRFRFYNPIFGALLISAPTFDDSNGVRVANLEFQMGDPTGGNNFLYMVHY